MTDEVRWTNNYLTDVEAMVDYLASVRTPTEHRNLVSRALTGCGVSFGVKVVPSRSQERLAAGAADDLAGVERGDAVEEVDAHQPGDTRIRSTPTPLGCRPAPPVVYEAAVSPDMVLTSRPSRLASSGRLRGSWRTSAWKTAGRATG
jgi:hypothetical protein